MFLINDRVVHVKTKTSYYIVGTPDSFRIEKDNQPAYAYQKSRLSTT